MLIAAIIFIVLFGFVYFETNAIAISKYKLNAGLKSPVKIVHITDLHAKEFSKGNKKLIEKIKSLEPDIVAFTGDLYSRGTKNIMPSIEFLGQLAKDFCVLYIPGNHEHGTDKLPLTIEKLRQYGVYVLSNNSMEMDINGQPVVAIGADIWQQKGIEQLEEELKALENRPGFKLFLCHYPEDYEKYKQYDFDLMLAGHAHGGQIALPFIGAIFAPGQGFFPKYDRGFFDYTPALEVSRGLGTSGPAIRLFARPEIVLLEIT